MSKEKLDSIPDNIIDAVRRFDGDYLADVFRPWDCYFSRWWPSLAILYRFESDDVLVYTEDGKYNFRIAPIDTNTFESSVAKLLGVDLSKECLCWRRAADYQRFLGEKCVGRSLLSCLQ